MNDRAVTIAVGEMLCVPISNVDLQESQQSGESEEGPVIPLLLQNKPPVDEEANNRDELADLHLRPEAVSVTEPACILQQICSFAVSN